MRRLLLRLTTAIVATSIAAPSTASANYICWIGVVTSTAAGVEITLTNGNQLTRVQRAHGPADVLIVLTPTQALPQQSLIYPVALSIVAQVGDEIEYAQPHEDCKLSVINREDTIDVLARAIASLPGTPRATAETFIPAR